VLDAGGHPGSNRGVVGIDHGVGEAADPRHHRPPTRATTGTQP
jgi:hypothetical protein